MRNYLNRKELSLKVIIMKKNTKQEGTYFTINDVAKEVGVVPATIRNWEKAGLITVRRSENGYRIFDIQDIEFLKKIKSKSKDENLSINSIRLLTSPKSHPDYVRSAPHDGTQKLLGSRWKEYRLKHNFSLEDVADRVGISASYLSKIENEQANTSYEILQKLANFYGENLLYYLNDYSEDTPIVKGSDAEYFELGPKGLRIQSLIERKDHTLSALLYTVEPGCEKPDDTPHTGEEFVYVLSGKVEFIVNGGNSYMLSAGDAISYSSTSPHRWINRSGRQAKMLWVYTPLEKI